MAITDKDKQALSDLVFRALDTIEENYGENAELTVGCLVFEVIVRDVDDPDNEDECHWHGNYKSTYWSSPHHVAGLLTTAANKMME